MLICGLKETGFLVSGDKCLALLFEPPLTRLDRFRSFYRPKRNDRHIHRVRRRERSSDPVRHDGFAGDLSEPADEPARGCDRFLGGLPLT
jgi:hypothetical protein